MLQSVSSVFVVYRRKTLTGSPDPTHANGTKKPCIICMLLFTENTTNLLSKAIDHEIQKLFSHQILVTILYGFFRLCGTVSNTCV